MNQELSRQVLAAIADDSSTLQAVAQAIAADDADTVQRLVAGRGVALDASQVRGLLAQARVGSGDSAACTGTFTCTCTCTCT